MSSVERVVYDTNVWISGLLWRGAPYKCLLLAKSGCVRLVYCDAMLEELLSKLRQSFNFSEDDLLTVENEVLKMADRIEISNELRFIEADPTDDKFIECAMEGGAKVIVSGDKHLIQFSGTGEISVVTPAQFLDRIQQA